MARYGKSSCHRVRRQFPKFYPKARKVGLWATIFHDLIEISHQGDCFKSFVDVNFSFPFLNDLDFFGELCIPQRTGFIGKFFTPYTSSGKWQESP